MTEKKVYKVKNRSAGRVGYKIPELSIRREYEPGEIKSVTIEELEKLSYQPGGRALMMNYLQIVDENILNEFSIHAEPEYFMNEAQVKDLLVSGTDDELRDCLDFAPTGVIDLVKDIAVKLPLNDYNKRKIIQEKTGFNCDAAIRHEEEEKNSTKTESTAPEAPKRRTSGDKYRIKKD